MKLEYTELPTMLDVAQAQDRGEKIEYLGRGIWDSWGGEAWLSNVRYRSVREVKPKTAKLLAYRDSMTGRVSWFTAEEHCVNLSWLKRFATADQEYEVEE